MIFRLRQICQVIFPDTWMIWEVLFRTNPDLSFCIRISKQNSLHDVIWDAQIFLGSLKTLECLDKFEKSSRTAYETKKKIFNKTRCLHICAKSIFYHNYGRAFAAIVIIQCFPERIPQERSPVDANLPAKLLIPYQ